MNELNKHKKSDAVKWVIVFVLIAVLIAGVAAIGYKTFGGEEKEKSREEETLGAIDENGWLLSDGKAHAVPKSIIYRAVGTSVTDMVDTVILQATVIPETATFAELEWSLSFSDFDPYGWCYDKVITDYVTLDVGEDTHTATVKCHQPFGTQIIITVASKYDDSIRKTCTVDYLRDYVYTGIRIDTYAVEKRKDPIEQEVFSTEDFFVSLYDNGKMRETGSFGITVEYGIGTVNPTFTESATFTYSEELLAIAEKYQDGTDWGQLVRDEGGELSHNKFDPVTEMFTDDEGTHYWVIPLSGISFCWAYNNSAIIGIGHIDDFLSDIREAVKGNADFVIGTLTIDLTDIEHDKTVTGKVDFKVDPNTLQMIEDVELSESELLFGGGAA